MNPERLARIKLAIRIMEDLDRQDMIISTQDARLLVAAMEAVTSAEERRKRARQKETQAA